MSRRSSFLLALILSSAVPALSSPPAPTPSPNPPQWMPSPSMHTGFVYWANGLRYWYNRWTGAWEQRGGASNPPNSPAPPGSPPAPPPQANPCPAGFTGEVWTGGANGHFVNCENGRVAPERIQGDLGGPVAIPPDVLADPRMDDPAYFKDRARHYGVPDDQMADAFARRAADRSGADDDINAAVEDGLREAYGRDPTDAEVATARDRASRSGTKNVTARRIADTANDMAAEDDPTATLEERRERRERMKTWGARTTGDNNDVQDGIQTAYGNRESARRRAYTEWDNQ